ncbi:MAG: ribonuclease P protein component [Actinobacteria bacterium]|nr:ribonuclease P protein component [Actinomycetota bacterium]
MSGRPGVAARRSKRGRLSRSAEFDRVFRQGRSHGNRVLVLYGFPRPDASQSAAAPVEPRLGLSVSRRVGGAVERNHVKRLLREAFEREAERLPAGHDIVVVARPEARVVAERDGLEGILTALVELIDQLRARVEGEGR